MTTNDRDIRDLIAASWYRWLYVNRPITATTDTINTVPPQFGSALQAAFLAGAHFARQHR